MKNVALILSALVFFASSSFAFAGGVGGANIQKKSQEQRADHKQKVEQRKANNQYVRRRMGETQSLVEGAGGKMSHSMVEKKNGKIKSLGYSMQDEKGNSHGIEMKKGGLFRREKSVITYADGSKEVIKGKNSLRKAVDKAYSDPSKLVKSEK